MAGRRGRAHNLSASGGATLLTPDLAEKLLLARQRYHLFDSQIAIACGVGPKTLKRWIEQGLLPDAQEPYASFAQSYAMLQLEHEQSAVDAILNPQDIDPPPSEDPDVPMTFGQSKKQRDWKGYAWYLERRFPKRWNPAAQAAGGPTEAIDIEQLIQGAEDRQQRMSDVLNDAPPEIRAALRASAAAVRAILDEPEEDESLPALTEG